MKELDKRIYDIFSKNNIEYVSAIPFEKCRVINERKLGTLGFAPCTAIVFAMPYFSGLHEANISLYAVCRDYHMYAHRLFETVISELFRIFPSFHFKGFADSSPIDEVSAAAMCGIGVLGQNDMIITDKYSSFVFLGAVLCDVPFDNISSRSDFEIKRCIGCGKCKDSCPKEKHGQCLSSLTQKKGELEDAEREYISEYGSVWGCDICQLVCPYTKKAVEEGNITPIEFFKTELIKILDKQTVEKMSKEQFEQRAFSWRGKQTVLRNIDIWEK